MLPHPGGGGERYVHHLEAMPAFRFGVLPLTAHGRTLELPGGLAYLRRNIPEHDLIHIHGDSAGLASLPVIGSRPTVLTLHGSHLIRRSSGARGSLVRLGARWLFGRVDAVIAVSEAERDQARAIAPEAAARIELIDNGVPEPRAIDDEDRRVTREQLELGSDSVAALFVGELSERKQPLGFAQAVRAARAEDPRLVGLVAGEGPLLAGLESQQGEGLRVLGSRPDVERLLAAADVFVLPSRWEGLSYALLEAMAAGKATLVSDGPGNPDAVGDAGLVFPVGDVLAMAAALVRLAGDPALRESLGRSAAARVGERFTLSRMVAATAGVYERVLGR